MNRRLPSLLLLLALGLAPRAAAQCDCPAEDAIVIGHRGNGSDGSGAAEPENTIASAQAAFAAGERAPRRAVAGLDVVEVAVAEAAAYADADTPDDLPPGAVR